MTDRITLLETIRIRGGSAPLWGLHLARLYRSCKELGVPPPLTLDVPRGGKDRVRRLAVSSRGVEVAERAVGSTAPVDLITSSVPHRPYPHKVAERGLFERAREEARREGADDAVMLTEDGWVGECAVWSLFWWDDDAALATSPLDLGVLPGVARARIAFLVPVHERRIARSALDGRPLFVANAARGIVQVKRLDGVRVPRSDRTDALAARFWG
jgi:branched-subunit amino acid aminotransferase/4-amino-4-deoxychorismate lyase